VRLHDQSVRINLMHARGAGKRVSPAPLQRDRDQEAEVRAEEFPQFLEEDRNVVGVEAPVAYHLAGDRVAPIADPLMNPPFVVTEATPEFLARRPPGLMREISLLNEAIPLVPVGVVDLTIAVVKHPLPADVIQEIRDTVLQILRAAREGEAPALEEG